MKSKGKIYHDRYYFRKFQFMRKIPIRNFPKLKTIPDFEMVYTKVSAIILTKKTQGHRAYLFRKHIFLCVSEKNEYLSWELFLASATTNWFVSYIFTHMSY